MTRQLLILSLALTLGACAGTSLSVKDSGPGQPLLAQAEEYELSGDLSQAIALTERAVRINPRDAYAWHRLARLHFKSGELDKAEQLARRSQQFARGNRALIRANEELITQIRARRHG